MDADLRHPGLQHQEQRRAEHHLCQLCPQRSPVREHCHVQGTGELQDQSNLKGKVSSFQVQAFKFHILLRVKYLTIKISTFCGRVFVFEIDFCRAIQIYLLILKFLKTWSNFPSL